MAGQNLRIRISLVPEFSKDISRLVSVVKRISAHN